MEIINIITIISILIVALWACVNNSFGVALFVLLTIIAPAVKIGGHTVVYGVVAFPFLLIALVISNIRIKRDEIRQMVPLIVYILVLILSSVISLCNNEKAVFMVYRFFGIFRLIMEMWIIIAFGKKDSIRKVLDVSVIFNLFVMILQYFDPNSYYWTAALYATDSAQSITSNSQHILNRLTGTFSNTVPVAMFMIFMIVLSLSEICIKKNMVHNFIILIMAFICGFLSVSKAYIILFVIMFGAWIFISSLSRFKEYKLFKGMMLGMFCAMAVLIFVAYQIIPKLRFSAVYMYYINSIISGRFMNSRFGQEGNQMEAIRVFLDNICLGVGNVKIRGEFIGDSEIVTILHDAGLVGLIILEGYMLHRIYKSYKIKNFVGIQIKILVMAVSVISSAIFSNTGTIIFAFGLLCDKEKMDDIIIQGNYKNEQKEISPKGSVGPKITSKSSMCED